MGRPPGMPPSPPPRRPLAAVAVCHSVRADVTVSATPSPGLTRGVEVPQQRGVLGECGGSGRHPDGPARLADLDIIASARNAARAAIRPRGSVCGALWSVARSRCARERGRPRRLRRRQPVGLGADTGTEPFGAAGLGRVDSSAGRWTHSGVASRPLAISPPHPSPTDQHQQPAPSASDPPRLDGSRPLGATRAAAESAPGLAQALGQQRGLVGADHQAQRLARSRVEVGERELGGGRARVGVAAQRPRGHRGPRGGQSRRQLLQRAAQRHRPGRRAGDAPPGERPHGIHVGGGGDHAADRATSGATKPSVPTARPGTSPTKRGHARGRRAGVARCVRAGRWPGYTSPCTTPAACSPASALATGASTVTDSPTLR